MYLVAVNILAFICFGVDKQKAKAIKQAKKLLQQEGIIPLDEPIAS